MQRKASFILTILLLPGIAAADTVLVPLSVPLEHFETVLREQTFTAPGNSLRFGADSSGCQYLELRQPALASNGGKIRLRTDAEARLGQTVAGRCIVLSTWYGQLEFDQHPAATADGKAVVLRTTGWRAFKPNGSPDTVANTIGQWLDAYLPPGMKETRIDLAQQVVELERFLASMLAQDAATSRLRALGIHDVEAEEERIAVRMEIDFIPIPAPAPRPEPALTSAELAKLSERLDAVDAFFTFTIRELAEDGRSDLTDLLHVIVELRRDLVAVLAEAQWQQTDPARLLFVQAWEALTPVFQVAAATADDQTASLRYLSFISAGDALTTLDRLGPAAGIEVTSDGLRRLARMLIPESSEDPLAHGEGVDAALRRAFGFGPPLPAPRFAPEASWLEWFIPSAVAATSVNPKLADRLNNWVPKTRDIPEYLPMVREVLHHVIDAQLRSQPLAAEYHPVYRRLVFAAAWQESCWRQFTARDNMRVPVQSGTGDLGMMQINPKVWRGFYDLQGLRWDIVYNARAGADILQHHLINYAVEKDEHRLTGSIDNLARAAYAAYNGGPRQFDRYRRADASAHGKKVDELFWEKYLAVKAQGEMAVSSCYSG